MIDPDTLTETEIHLMDTVAHALPTREEWPEWLEDIFGGTDCE